MGLEESHTNKEDVDFVLVYVDNGNSIHAQKRETFEKALMEQGLRLEYEQNRQLCIVKLYASEVIVVTFSFYIIRKRILR